jgi:hypothetical protein
VIERERSIFCFVSFVFLEGFRFKWLFHDGRGMAVGIAWGRRRYAVENPIMGSQGD